MNIRLAKYDDLKDILSLVKELAHYEKEPDAVWADLSDYQKAFQEEVFEALVLERDDRIVGTCVYYLTWSTWKGRMLYLEDFIIRQDYRNRGLGQKLFDAFIERAIALDCVQIKWQVLDWNVPAIKFYEKNGATIEKEWWNGKLLLKSKE